MASGSTILALDCNRCNLRLLESFLRRHGHAVRTECTVDALDGNFDQQHDVSLVLIDAAGFGPAIWQRCEQLRRADIPFIVFSRCRHDGVHRQCLRHGAAAVLAKPVVPGELLAVIQRVLRKGE